MAQKKIIEQQPTYIDRSQYNFSNDYSGDFAHDDSIGVPKENDKFQGKDLYTTFVNSDVNNAIIERNLKAEGESFIRIDELYVARTDSRESKHNKVEAYLFSQRTLDPRGLSYNVLKSELNSGIKKRFFSQEFGERDRDLGNMTNLEGNKILFNMDTGPEFGDFNNSDTGFGGGAAQNFGGSLDTVLSSDLLVNTQVIDEDTSNPLYFCFRLKGNKDQWIGTDVRKSRYQVYKIDNLELFNRLGNSVEGKQTEFTLDTLEKVRDVSGDGGGFGVESPAHKITNLRITINTSKQGTNDWQGDPDETDTNDEKDYERFFKRVRPSYALSQQAELTNGDLLSINHDRQLNNTSSAGPSAGNSNQNDFPDFFPFTEIYILNQDNSVDTDVDVQSYYEDDLEKSFKGSAPATVALNYRTVGDPSELEIDMEYFSFVIDWDDKDDKIKTFQDWEDNRPSTIEEIRELQNKDLYVPKYATSEFKYVRVIFFRNGNQPSYITPATDTGANDNFTHDFMLNIQDVIGPLTSGYDGIEYDVFFQVSELDTNYPSWGQHPYPNLFHTRNPKNLFANTQFTKDRVTTRVKEIFGSMLGPNGEEFRNLTLDYIKTIDMQHSDNFDYNEEVEFFGSWTIGTASSRTIEELYFRYEVPIEGADEETQTHTYNTPGIKTIKSIVINYNSEKNELGRWKLCTSRIFLDIPVNQYPDFGELGGTGYTTIPWPYTTAIIGGVDEDSKYKKSVRDAISSGNIGDTDIIDEKFLVNDRDNEELGQSIKQMDLEQCRYFNTSYGMNTLLGIDVVTEDGFRPFNYGIDSPNEIEDVSFETIQNTNNNVSLQWFVDGATTSQTLYPNDIIKKGIRIKSSRDSVPGNSYTFFKYMRKDLKSNLKTFEQGGTEYTFRFEIKFNEWTPLAPKTYEFRPANRENDYGTPYYGSQETSEFGRNRQRFYFSEDGIYADDTLTDKLSDYGEWITVEKTRTLISNYSSSRGEMTGYPNMEFITGNWFENLDGEVLFPYHPDLLEATLGDNFWNTDEYYQTLIEAGLEPYFDLVWNGNDGFEVTGESVLMPIIKVSEIDENGVELNNSVNRIGWMYQSINDPNDEDLWQEYPNEDDTYWVRPENELGSGTSSESILSTGLLQNKTYRFHFPPNISIALLESLFEYEWFYYDAGSNIFDETQTIDFEIRGPVMLPTEIYQQTSLDELNQTSIYWDGELNKFSEESSVGQIFISENQDNDLRHNCKLELNTGELSGKSIFDSSGNSNKGILIGDYKVKKVRKGEPMRRDSFIKIPKKTGNDKGAL